MKRVNIYNVKKYIEKKEKGWTTHFQHELVVIEGPKGVIVCCAEGVHWLHESLEHTFVITVSKKEHISVIAEGEFEITLGELISNCSKRKGSLGKFVRKFGDRLERNYSLLLKNINKIGLNPNDYPRR